MPPTPAPRRLALQAVAVALLAAAARPQEAAAPEGSTLPTRMTGSWWGARPWLEEHGVEVTGGLLFDWSAPWSGGLRQRDTARALLDVSALLDLETLAAIPRTQVFVDVQRYFGRDGSLDVGDFQVFDNIDAPHGLWVAEVWAETRLLDEALRIKAGKVDANTEFAVIDAATEFVQSSAGFTPTIVAFPSYPDPATSVNVFAYPGGGLYAGAAVYDGALADGIRTGRLGPKNFFSDDESGAWFLIGEVGVRWDGAHVGIGAWHHTADFRRFDGGRDGGTEGVYAAAEMEVLGGEQAGGPSLSLFAHGGLADEDVSPAAWHALVGVTGQGWVPGRPDDRLGLLVSHVDMSDAAGAGFPEDETAFELHYLLRATPFLFVQPGVHLILNPSGRTDVEDAWVGLLRIGIEF